MNRNLLIALIVFTIIASFCYSQNSSQKVDIYDIFSDAPLMYTSNSTEAPSSEATSIEAPTTEATSIEAPSTEATSIEAPSTETTPSNLRVFFTNRIDCVISAACAIFLVSLVPFICWWQKKYNQLILSYLVE
ncbi:unnamed protein product [Caenorhabditis bovis]|uniref:Uncharacterized protein n=1 Tax=Caenorhabditis bovis TaxID=2654633 RepID=A0A8S1EV86_9PELO|nr:unnamed protein product [Caenorhabditis bovis]